MSPLKDENQTNFIQPKKMSCRKWTKHIRIFVFALFILAGAASFQNITVNVLASIENLQFTIGPLDFGLRFPGEEADKYFTVKFVEIAGEANAPENYSIATYPKPLDENDKEHCRLYPADYEKCYRDLCDHLTITFVDANEPLDTPDSAWVSQSDPLDTWQVHLSTPAIAGMVAQDHGYGIIDSAGEYGCDIAINIETEEPKPYCGDGELNPELGEECDYGSNNGSGSCSINCKKTKTILTITSNGGYTPFRIYNENANPGCWSADFSWRTNKYSTSRVLCDTIPHSSLLNPPNYGYPISTSEYDLDPKTMDHSLTVGKLDLNTTYYCRVVSAIGSSRIISVNELTFTTLGEDACVKKEVKKKGEVKGASDVVIPKALPKTGFGGAGI